MFSLKQIISENTRRINYILLLAGLISSSNFFAVTNTINVSEDPSIWSLGHMPLYTENVIISGNASVSINSSAICGSLTIGDNSELPASISIKGTNILTISSILCGTGDLSINPFGKNKIVRLDVGAGSLLIFGSVSYGKGCSNLINTDNGSILCSRPIDLALISMSNSEDETLVYQSETEKITIESELGMHDGDLTIFPDPCSAISAEKIHMYLSGFAVNTKVLVILYDIMGKEYYSKCELVSGNGGGLYSIENSEPLAKGIYYITASSNDKLISRKLIVE